jgi:4-coumarate--CoA ligase
MERFDPAAFVAAIEKYDVTFAWVVPPVLLALLRHPCKHLRHPQPRYPDLMATCLHSFAATAQYDLTSLKTIVSGAAPLSGALVRSFREKLASHGAPNVAVLQGYGLTETAAATHVVPRLRVDEPAATGSIGMLLPSLEARVVVDEGGEHDAAPGIPGELWLRGKSVMKGYLADPVETHKAIDSQGWFRTGDVVTRNEEGFYYVVDRKKEMIKYKGYQGTAFPAHSSSGALVKSSFLIVAPAELEGVLLQHPSVADAAVIGIEASDEATELPR